jgi:hypothetical protein
MRHAHDGLDNLPAPRVLERLLDLIHLIVLDEAIEGEASLLMEFDERGNELSGPPSAEHANDPVAPQRREVAEGERGTSRPPPISTSVPSMPPSVRSTR